MLEENPVKDMDSPKLKKTLPRYLTLEESMALLDSVDGPNRERDYCILTLFLNCGLRISELIGLNRSDIQGEALHVLGKGNKVRIVYLNEACQAALEQYLAVRRPITGRDEDALFLSQQNRQFLRLVVPPSSLFAAVHGHGNDQAFFPAEPVRISTHCLCHHLREGAGQMNGSPIFESQQKIPQ